MAASSDCFAELGLLVNLWTLPQAILRWTYASITITEVAFFRDVERLVVDADEARLSTIIALPRSILQLCSLRFGKRRFVLAWRQWSGPSLLETLLDLLVVRLKYELWSAAHSSGCACLHLATTKSSISDILMSGIARSRWQDRFPLAERSNGRGPYLRASSKRLPLESYLT